MTDSSTPVSRRRIAQGAAWVVPTVIVGAAAPVAAESPCPTYTIDWAQFTNGTYPAGTATTTPARTPPLTMTWASAGPGFVKVSSGTDGGITGSYLEIGVPGGGTFTETVTFTLSAPVYNLKLIVGDIDSQGGASPVFQESAYLTWLTPPAFVPGSVGSNLTGSGTAADPWVGASGVSVPGSSGAGNATVTFPGPITSFSLSIKDVIASATGAGGHSIDLFALNFEYCPPPPGGGGETGGGCDPADGCGGG